VFLVEWIGVEGFGAHLNHVESDGHVFCDVQIINGLVKLWWTLANNYCYLSKDFLGLCGVGALTIAITTTVG